MSSRRPALVQAGSNARPAQRPGAVLAVMCLAVFAVNVDTTIVNVTLPTLVTELDATTRDLQWIVDSYLLVFAALVLAGGSLSDRLGRRAALLGGLAVFGAGNGIAALAQTPEQLIAARAFTGIGAALVFPTTLSILTQVFRGRAARAKAIGLWGASTGLAVAFGPITGGALLEQFWWGSTFLVKLPIAVLAMALVLTLVPESKDPAAPRLDVPGLVLSAAALAALVYTIIEAPERGWSSVVTLSGFAASAVLLAAFVRRERTTAEPMLDLALFSDRRFTAAALAITVAFFALFGFIFLITQYFQFLRGYSPFETGLRILPVAVCVALGSIAGTLLVVRLGNKLVVTTGLLSLSFAYAWISTASNATSYTEIAGQMVFLGLGMGLTSAPATESIMGAVQTDKAGIGSAVNDATREVGGTLGVAVIGSVFASLYAARLEDEAGTLPADLLARAEESVGSALAAAAAAPGGAGEALRNAAATGFFDGLQAGCLVASGVALLGAAVAAIALPARPSSSSPDAAPGGGDDDARTPTREASPPVGAVTARVASGRPGRRRRRALVTLLAVVTVAGAGTAAATRSGSGAGDPGGRAFVEVRVPRGPHTIVARDHPGDGPAIVLLHGFPDHSALWEPLVEHLAGRRVVTFDFLGWGASDKPRDHAYTFAEQQEDLEAVVRHLELTEVAVVGHDAGVPAAINWALDHPEQAVSVTAMNGFYSPVDGARPPGLIALLALGGFPRFIPLGPLPAGTASSLSDINDTLGAAPELFARHFEDMENGFFARADDADRFTPRFLEQFLATPSSFEPLRSLTADLFPHVQANGQRLDELAAMRTPLHLIWGAQDPYLTVDIPRELDRIAPRGSTTILDEARHNLQIDEPARVAALLLEQTGPDRQQP